MKCGLFGEKLAHSISPQIHASLGGGYSYELCEVSRGELGSYLRSCELDAFNVTVPYKKDILAFIPPSNLSATARLVGNVNTVVRRDGIFYGYNTDFFGFSYLLDKNNINAKGKKAVILGTGGAEATVYAVLTSRGAEKVTPVSRRGTMDFGNVAALISEADIIINATPVGMFPDNSSCPVDLSPLTSRERDVAVIELIYNPLKTRLLLAAEKLGLTAINGLDMLIAQADASRRIFLGTDRGDDALLGYGDYSGILGNLRRDICNIVLVGMPSCGKTVVGAALARLSGRRFVDTDTLITEIAGLSPSALLSAYGEPYFRKIERVAVEKAAAMTGIVLSSGGGAVLCGENRLALRQNGVVFYLTRPLDRLSVHDRPISKNSTPEELFSRRNPIYSAVADFTVENKSTPEDAAAEIFRLFNNKIAEE